MCRVTAGAGTGKTFTLEHISKRLIEKGHSLVWYCVFNRKNATEAKGRLPHNVKARTVHSTAYNALKNSELTDAIEDRMQADEALVREEVERICGEDVDDFICLVNEDNKMRAQDIIFNFIYKTLEQFCRSAMSMEKFVKKDTFNTAYYPAILWHERRGRGETPEGITYDINVAKRFYVTSAKKVWDSAFVSSYDKENGSTPHETPKSRGTRRRLSTYDSMMVRYFCIFTCSNC